MNLRTCAASLFVTAAVSLLAADRSSAQMRTWTDATGKFTVEGELVDLQSGKVHLKRADGRVITVALEQLSAADQEFAKARVGGPDQGRCTEGVFDGGGELFGDRGHHRGLGQCCQRCHRARLLSSVQP